MISLRIYSKEKIDLILCANNKAIIVYDTSVYLKEPIK